MTTPLNLLRDFDPEYGKLERISPLVRRIVARNPGPFTFRGTNTYVVGQGRVAIIDPGPAQPEHIDALMAGLAGETVTHIIITHTHLDHTAALPLLRRQVDAPTYGFGPHQNPEGLGGDKDFMPDRRIADGEAIEGEGWRLEALHTPGHAANHLCFSLPAEEALFSADHVMGWSTSIVSPPDGDMADYMVSLRRLLGRGERVYWPGHGPVIPDPEPHVRALIAHRQEREDSILDRLAGDAQTVEELVASIYGDLAPTLRPAAGRSVLAHLIALAGRGEVERLGTDPASARYRLADR